MSKISSLVFVNYKYHATVPQLLYKQAKVKPNQIFSDEWYARFDKADENGQIKLLKERFQMMEGDLSLLETIERSRNTAARNPSAFSLKTKDTIESMHKLAVLVGLVNESERHATPSDPLADEESDTDSIPDTVPIPRTDPKRLT